VILNTKRSSHWLDGAVFSPASVRYKVREVKAGRGSMRGRLTACFSRLTGCRDVDAGVLVMYTKACLQARNFSSVFTCFLLLVCVCLWEMVWCGVYILSFVFFLFFVPVSILYIAVPLQSFFVKFCTFLGCIGMQSISMAYCYRCSLVCPPVCWIQPWAMQKRINWSRYRLGCARLGSGSPERKRQCWGHVPPRY